MQVPLQITFRNIEKSEALAARIRNDSVKLERIHPHINRFRVSIQEMRRHHARGRPFEVMIEVRMPGRELAATKEDEDVYVAMREAFAAVRRQLEDAAREMKLA
jgi:ribosomal subunit interface protein